MNFFSVLIPVYNVEQYIDGCLESVFSQNFTDFEVVLVNDGSTDGSGVICDRWKERYPRQIRVIHRENQGISRTREQMFREAKGAYIVSLDSDDKLHPDALRQLHECICCNQADMVIYQFSSEEESSEPFREYPFEEDTPYTIATDAKLRQLMGATDLMPSIWSKAFRRELVEDVSIPGDITEGEDLLFSIYIMEKAQRIFFLNRVLYFYSYNETGITKSYNPRLFRSMKKVNMLQRSAAQRWDPTGQLARECDVGSLDRYYRILCRVYYAACPLKEKRMRLREIVEDPEFLRVYPMRKQLPGLKPRLVLPLSRRHIFAPFLAFAALKGRPHT